MVTARPVKAGDITHITEHDIRHFQDRLLTWYRDHGRHFPWRNKSANTYQKILAEVLLQRTQARAVSRFFPEFIRRFPSWVKLALASEEDLRGYLQPLGLWRRRAASLQRLALEMARRRGRFPENRGEIESLPGVGQYITNSILLFVHGEPHPLLDTNMARVLERYFGPRKLADIRYDPYLQTLSKAVINSDDAAELNWAILDHAALVCKLKNPRCGDCPVESGCKFASGLLSFDPGKRTY